MTKEDISKVIQLFVNAAKRAQECGFDVIEIHGAHGYLIHSFYSSLSNKRTDEYGGKLYSIV
jgi:NADPH2 dehydrogenase